MMKKILWMLIILFGVIIMTEEATAAITATGTFNTIGYVETAYYNVTLDDGGITRFIYFNVSTQNYATVSGVNASIGSLLNVTTGLWLLAPGVNTVTCTNASSATELNVSCSGLGGSYNNWTFYETYIRLYSYTQHTYRIYDYLTTNSTSTNIFYNTTHTVTNPVTWTTMGTLAGVAGYRQYASSTSIFAHTVEQAKVVSADIGNQTLDVPPSDSSLSFGRAGTIASKAVVLQYIRVLRNTTNSSWNAVLTEFKANPLYNDYGTVAITNLCNWSGSGNWLVENQTCQLNTTFNMLKNNITFKNVTLLINSSIRFTNYTNWWLISPYTVRFMKI